MTRLVVVGLMLIFLLGCGNAESGTRGLPSNSAGVASSTVMTAVTPTSMPTPSPTPTPVTTEQLRSALLTIDDMPDGWTISDNIGEDITSDNSDSSFCGYTDPLAAISPSVSIDFQSSDDISFATEEVDVIPVGQGEAVMNEIRTLLSCPGWTEPSDSGPSLTYQLAPLSFPSMGDDLVAARATVGDDITSAELDIVCIRVGNYAILIGDAALDNVNSSLTIAMAQRAVEKLRAFSQ